MRIPREDTIGLVIDIQEKLFPVMHKQEEFLKKCRQLMQGLGILEVPLLVTEQYPKGLGSTLQAIHEIIPSVRIHEKISFSCCGEPSVSAALASSGKKYVVVAGIEAHVCVLQTVVDLLDSGYMPVVIADCTTSREPGDLDYALKRMRSEGAILSTTESILFELLQQAGSETFKAISRLVK